MTAPVESFDTVKSLRLFFEELVDDGPDIETVYRLLSSAKNRIEVENRLKVLEAEDTSKTAVAGQNYQTELALPDNWRMTLKLYVNRLQYFPIGYGRRASRAHMTRRFFINPKDRTFGLVGPIATGGVIQHIYLVKSDDFTEATENEALSDVLLWPVEYAPIIAYEAAGFYQQGQDADSIATSQGQIQLARAEQLMDTFIDWDQELKLAEIGDSLGYDPSVDADELLDVGSLGA